MQPFGLRMPFFLRERMCSAADRELQEEFFCDLSRFTLLLFLFLSHLSLCYKLKILDETSRHQAPACLAILFSCR
ncbi:putative carrier C12B10.09 [Fusarium oxysporum f. sp. albedinis]|nr:putative carrier C12B10.09 [Fusarium oxysporum f. sp. albedinis]